MIFHTVLFKIKQNSSKEELDNFYTGVKSLSVIPGVLSVSIDPIDSNVYLGYDDRTKGYTHVLSVILKDKKSLEGYDKDPFHLTIKSTIIKPMLEANTTDPVLAVDWEGELPKVKTCCFAQLGSCKTMSMVAAGLLVVAGIVVMRSRL